jgi:hypothetical protein
MEGILHNPEISLRLYLRHVFLTLYFKIVCVVIVKLNPLTPELNPYAQRCLTRFFTGDFAS